MAKVLSPGEIVQTFVDTAVDCCSVLNRARPGPRQQLDPFINRADWIDVKLSISGRSDDIRAQNEIADIGGRNQHALLAGQAAHTAHIEEAFDLFVDAANSLP